MTMRLYEIADAKAQLELLRIIIDNTWSAIAQQAEQQKRSDAERKALAKLKPRTKKSRKGTSIRIPTPPPLPPKQPQVQLAKQPPSSLNNLNPNALNAVKPPPTNPQIKPSATITAIKPTPAFIPQPKPIVTTSIKPSNGLKLSTLEKEEDWYAKYRNN